MKNRRIWIIVVAFVLIVFGLPTAFFVMKNRREQAALEEQLRLARQEGLPTTGDEFAAMLPKVKDSENAAILYMKLADSHKKLYQRSFDIEKRILIRPSPAEIKEAKQYLEDFGPELELVDRATKLPRCVFKRDWYKGFAVLHPELYPVKRLASMILLRGSLEANKGHAQEALSNLRECLQVSRHMDDAREPMCILIGKAVQNNALKTLASWSMTHLNEPIYREELGRILQELKPIDLKAVHRLDLMEVFSAIDMCETPEGQKQMGLKPGEASKLDKIMPFFRSKRVSKTMIVRSLRQYFKALEDKSTGFQDRLSKAKTDYYIGLSTFPTVEHIFSQLSADPNIEYRWAFSQESEKILIKAYLRATQSGRIAKKINTLDLLSPYTGNPVSYSYDGKQIVISLSVGNGADPVKIRVPPQVKP